MSSAPIEAGFAEGAGDSPPAKPRPLLPSRLLHAESFRLAVIYASIFLLFILLYSIAVYFSVDAAFRAEALKTADADIATVNGAYVKQGIFEAQEVIEQNLASPRASDIFLLQQNGKKLAGNLPALSPVTGIAIFSVDGLPILGRGTFLAPGLYVFAGRDLTIMRETERGIFSALAWISGGGLLMAAAGGILLSRSFIARMDTITRTCRAIMEGRFTDRIPTKGNHNELDNLALVINAMLDRITTLMENLKQVSSDIAHDLRTPLTRLRNQLERAGNEARNKEEYAAALNGALTETDGILALFAALLRIAQIESGSRKAGFTRVDLEALLHHIAEIYRPAAEDENHPFALDIRAPAAIQGDRELLIQLLANLIDNAIRHTPAGTKIVLGLGRRGTALILSVADTGPGIAVDQREKLFRRFTRLEQSRTTPGHGLGLAMVAAIADLHGATVSITDNRPGTRLDVRFEPT
jgi:signal transduction histidine kinase